MVNNVIRTSHKRILGLCYMVDKQIQFIVGKHGRPTVGQAFGHPKCYLHYILIIIIRVLISLRIADYISLALIYAL